MFQTVLVALDGGPQHDPVLSLASSVAGPRSRVHLLCVLDPQYALADDAMLADQREYPQAARELHRAQALLQDALDTLRERGVDARAHHPAGDPGQTISRMAGELGCDLIVIGHRHLGGLKRLFDASVGQWTLDHAPCPVLVQTQAGLDGA